MKKKLALIASIITFSLFYYLQFQSPVSLNTDTMHNVLVVGTSADYPPYAQIDLETGEIVGLEIDVIKEIAQRTGKEIVIKDMPFNTLIVQLMAGQIDLIAAGMAPSPERAKTVLFSHSYNDNDANIVISKKDNDAIATLEDLYGKPVAVNIGYMADTFLSQYPQIQLVRLKTPADGFMALQSNSVQAFAIAQSIFNKYLEQHSDNHSFKFFILPSPADACALAYNKNNSKLQNEIDPVIDAMIEDGTINIIKKKWGFE